MRPWRAFAATAGADLPELRDPLDSFGSLQDFSRARQRGRARSTPTRPRSWCRATPLERVGRIAGGTLLQLKGRPYSLAALLGDAEVAKSFERGWFATFYLAPRDYHASRAVRRFVSARRLPPGSLWPVNRIGLGRAEPVRRERADLRVRLRAGDAPESLGLVAGGATLVGKVHVTFDTLTTNTRTAAPRWRRTTPPQLVKGGEWGRFEFGSTLVLAAAPGALELAPRPPGSLVRLGERIGTIT
jgi:phosphatidylserine decarboxylase